MQKICFKFKYVYVNTGGVVDEVFRIVKKYTVNNRIKIQETASSLVAVSSTFYQNVSWLVEE